MGTVVCYSQCYTTMASSIFVKSPATNIGKANPPSFPNMTPILMLF
jgi:hypothetical protein